MMPNYSPIGLTFFGVSIALLVVFVSDYFFKLSRLKQHVGNIKKAVDEAITGIGINCDGKALVQVIKNIQEHEVKLLMPVRENKILRRASNSFVLLSITTAIIGLYVGNSSTQLQNTTLLPLLLYVSGISMILLFFFSWWLVKLEISYLEVVKEKRGNSDSKVFIRVEKLANNSFNSN